MENENIGTSKKNQENLCPAKTEVLQSAGYCWSQLHAGETLLYNTGLDEDIMHRL